MLNTKVFLDRHELEVIYQDECAYADIPVYDDIPFERNFVHYRSVENFPFISMNGPKTGSYICIGKIRVHRGDLLVLELQDSDPLKNGTIYLYGEVKGFYYRILHIEADLSYYVSSALCDCAEESSYLIIDRDKHEKTPVPEDSYQDDYEDRYRDRYGLIKVAKNFDEFKLGEKFKENFIKTTIYV